MCFLTVTYFKILSTFYLFTDKLYIKILVCMNFGLNLMLRLLTFKNI